MRKHSSAIQAVASGHPAWPDALMLFGPLTAVRNLVYGKLVLRLGRKIPGAHFKAFSLRLPKNANAFLSTAG
jgi:hypothetical protein